MTEKADGSTLRDDLIWGATAVAVELGIDRRTVEALVVEGKIPGARIGGRIVVSRRRLREFFYNAAGSGRGV